MFCPKCKSLMYPQGDFLVCKKCGNKLNKTGKKLIVSKQEKKELEILEDKIDILL